MQTPFLHNLLDKLGVSTRMGRREEFKGAVNSLTDDTMPVPQRANMQALVDSWVAQVADAIARNRHLDPVLARQLIDRGPYSADAARTAGLIDATRYWDQAESSALKRARDGGKTFTLADYASALPRSPKCTPRIAVIYGVRDVVLGTR